MRFNAHFFNPLCANSLEKESGDVNDLKRGMNQLWLCMIKEYTLAAHDQLVFISQNIMAHYLIGYLFRY